jgi:small ligand-binding sensory domain FIST
MTFAAALSRATDTVAALDQAVAAVSDQVSGPDLVVAFASAHHLGAAEKIAATIAEMAPTSLGAVAEAVIGGPEEADDGPGISIWAGHLPGADLRPAHLEAVRTPKGTSIGGLPDSTGLHGAVMIADPFTFPTGALVSALADDGLPVVGGLAYAGGGPGNAGLILDGDVYDHGALFLGVGGDVVFRPLVSQGCRPLGEPVTVTGVEDTWVTEIAGVAAVEHLTELLRSLDAADRALAQRGLQLGVVVDEHQLDFSQGDFLIRGIMGIDQDRGAIQVGERLDLGQTVQFQVRDPGSADGDLRSLLEAEHGDGGVLVFSCNARGRSFFGSPHHDAALVDEVWQPEAIAGFFAAGEIGPVGKGNFIHGYTASIVELAVDQ